MKRWISGIIMAIIAILFFYHAKPDYVYGLGILAAMIACGEMLKLFHEKIHLLKFFMGILFVGASLFILFFISKNHLLAILVSIFIISCILHLKTSDGLTQSLHHLTSYIFSLFYCILLFSFLGWLFDQPQGRSLLFITMGATFGSDTGAYVFGKAFGKHKLAPRISPGKTIQGYFGGIIGGVLVSQVIRLILWPESSIMAVILIGLAVTTIAPLGDLTESLIKRGVGKKDSSQLIPGHGGILDRLDALLFAGPIVYYLAPLLGLS